MQNDLMIFENKETAVVSSRTIAEKFGKEHSKVLRTISDKIEVNPILDSPKYFIEHKYLDKSNRQSKEYLLTRDGFSFIVMGFTGKESDEWKIKYIETFNQMESFIREKQTSNWKQTRLFSKEVRRNETDIIRDKLIPLAISQGSNHPEKLYMAYSKLVNLILEIESNQRDSLPINILCTIPVLENMMENIISDEVDKSTNYKEIYQVCKAKCQILKEMKAIPTLQKKCLIN